MPRSAALPGLAALCALAGCFQVQLDSCRLLCTTTADCPGDMTCQLQGKNQVCVSPNTMCLLPDASTDAIDAHGIDAGSTDAEAGTSLPPQMLCHNGQCFTLSDTFRSNLVLLLWPSNLPAVGSTVAVWADQSGQGNDAHALYPSAPPLVIPDGVHLDPAQVGSGFVVANSPSLDFGSGDFAVIVVAGLSSATAPVTLLRKSDSLRTNSRQIAIDWVLSSALTGRPQGTVDDTLVSEGTDIAQPSVTEYGLYRSVDDLELHVNGAVLGTAALPSPGLTTSNAEDLYLGVGSQTGSPADSIEAVLAVRGSIGSTELTQFETFLRSVFARPGQ